MTKDTIAAAFMKVRDAYAGRMAADEGCRWYHSRHYRQLIRSLDDPNLGDARRELIYRELRLRDDTRLTVGILLILSICGLIVANIAQWQLAGHRGTSEALASLWGIAMLTAGALIGFLFGIPRAAAADVPSTGRKNGSRPNGRPAALMPNTNLEQVSDWLTKILIGVGLVEAHEIGGKVVAIAGQMAQTSGGIASVPLAMAILVTFAGLGFLIGYLTTRMFLSPIFLIADGSLSADAGVTARAAVLAAPAEPIEPAADRPSEADRAAAERSARELLTRVKPPRVTDAFDLRYARAKALLLVRQFARAVVEYGPLIADKPDDLRLRRERLWARFNRGPTWDADIARELDALYERRHNESDRVQTYLSLTFHYLYDDTATAAESARRVVDLVTEYERDGGRREAGLLINRACGHAMLARLGVASTADAASAAAADIRSAIAVEPAALNRLRKLMNPDARDNDLAVFRDSPTVRAALDLPPNDGPASGSAGG